MLAVLNPEVPLSVKRTEADGGRTMADRARHPLDETPYDMTDDKKTHRVPRGALAAIWGFISAKRKTKCVNPDAGKYYKRRFRCCPVPVAQRHGRDQEEGPWPCGYCRLFGSPEPEGI